MRFGFGWGNVIGTHTHERRDFRMQLIVCAAGVVARVVLPAQRFWCMSVDNASDLAANVYGTHSAWHADNAHKLDATGAPHRTHIPASRCACVCVAGHGVWWVGRIAVA